MSGTNARPLTPGGLDKLKSLLAAPQEPPGFHFVAPRVWEAMKAGGSGQTLNKSD